MERRKQLDQYYGLARSVRIYGPNNLLVILILCNITVIENAGSYRTTRHTYKLLFHRRTTIIPSKDDSIPRNGFTMMDAEEIKNTNGCITNPRNMHLEDPGNLPSSILNKITYFGSKQLVKGILGMSEIEVESHR
ncbi:hypothetical protein JHK87_000823 [Glycine soja]|nr:hypothetical protein JHK87_000823 [Glycine soja]